MPLIARLTPNEVETDFMQQLFVTHRTQDGETALQLAIKNQLPLVVDAICTRGADMSVPDERGNPPLWLALENNLEDIASTLVKHSSLTICFIF